MTLPWPPPDPRISALIDDAAPGIIGTVDDVQLVGIATRLQAAASRLAELSSSIDDAHMRYRLDDFDVDPDTLTAAIDAGRLRLTGPEGGIGRVWTAVTGVVAALGDYRTLVAETGTELSLTAAVADREMVRDEIADRIGLVGSGGAAHLVGREMVAAVADDAVVAAQDLSQGSGTGLPMVAGAVSAGIASAGIVAGRSVTSAGARPPEPAGDVDTAALAGRAARLSEATPAGVRMAVGEGISALGAREIVVGTSDPAPYLRRGVDAGDVERLVGTGAEPELAVVADFVSRSVTPVAVAAVGTPPAVAAALAVGGVASIDVVDRAGEVAVEGWGADPATDPALGG